MCHQHLQLHRVDINNFGQIVANKIIYLVMTMQYCIPCFPHTKRWVFTGLSRLIVTATLIDVEIADDAATSQVTSFPNQTDRIRIKQSRVDRRVRPENIQLSTFDQPSQPWPTNMQSSSHKGWRTIAKKTKGYGRRRKELNRIQDQMNHSHLAEAPPPLQCEWYSSGLDWTEASERPLP
jgi:hypothetical protein